MKFPSHMPGMILLATLLASAGSSNADTAETEAHGVKFPDTAAAELMAEWVDLCLQPELAQMTAWMSKHLSSEGAGRMSAQARAVDLHEVCASNGGLDAVAVANADPVSIALTLRGHKSGSWFE